MIEEEKDIDLNILSDYFTECGDYTKEIILDELEYYKKNTDFLVLVSRNGDIDGFLIGYRNRNSLWIAQAWHRNNGSAKDTKIAFEMAKEWAREHNMTSLTFETKRKEMRAMEKYGWKEESVCMKYEL